MLEREQLPDGSYELRRRKLDATTAKHYTVSERTLDELQDQRTSYEDAKAAHDGYLASWTERGRFERDGKQWVLVQESYFEYAVELELRADGGIGAVVAVAPERAYELARAADPPSVIQEA